MAQAFGGLVGGIMQMGAAKSAQKAQERAAEQQLGLSREVFDYVKGINQPYQDSGALANAIMQYELFGGEAPVMSVGGYSVGGQTYGTRAEAEAALAAATDRFNQQSAVRTPIVSRQRGSEGDERYDSRLITGIMNSRSMSDADRERALASRGVTFRTDFDPERGISAAGFDPRGATVEEVNPVRYEGGSLPGLGGLGGSAAAGAMSARQTFAPPENLARQTFAPETMAGPAEYTPVAYDERFMPGGLSFEDFMSSPDYTFALQQGQGAVTSAAAAKGGLKSGATLKALMEYGQGLASARYSDYIDRQDRLYSQYLGREDQMYGYRQGRADDLYKYGQNRADSLYQFQQGRADVNHAYDQSRGDALYQFQQGRADANYEYDQNRADNRSNVYLNALLAMAGRGQVATGQLQQGSNSYLAGATGALGALGNAQSAGAIARGNIGSEMVQNGVQGIASMYSGMGGMGGFGSIASQFMGGGGFGSIGGSGIY